MAAPMRSSYMGRWILSPEGVKRGFLRIEGDEVAEICEGDAPPDSTRSLVLPSFIDAHTHIGDSVAYPAPGGSLEDLVAPPSGYKHRVLRSTSRSTKIDAMKHAMLLMSSTGTSVFADYREEGLEGVGALSEALMSRSPRAIVLGRPLSSEATDDEIDAILEKCDGMAMSAVRDWPFELLERISRATSAAGKIFSVHTSEAVREDIGPVLELKPDFLVHMVKATDDDLERCVDAKVPIIVCPTSNRFFGLKADYARLMKMGIAVGLGTDNGMITRPDMLAELKAAYATRAHGVGLTPLEAVNMAVFGGRKVLNPKAKITLETGLKSDLSVVSIAGDDPISEMVTSVGSKDIEAVVRGGKVWRPESWKT